MNSSPILCNIQEGIATLTLNRSEVHNALDREMIDLFTSILLELEHNPSVRMLLLRGAGKHFCAGADLKMMQKIAHNASQENKEEAEALAKLFYTLYHFSKPSLALVQGNNFGGGVGLIACCQLVIVSHKATFCFSEVKLGLIPAIITPYIIEAIGKRQARTYFLTGLPFDAYTALRMGLCFDIASEDSLEDYAQALTKHILKQAPKAQIAVNTFLNTFSPLDSSLIKKTAAKNTEIRLSPEAKEGIAAFLEKRPPSWKIS